MTPKKGLKYTHNEVEVDIITSNRRDGKIAIWYNGRVKVVSPHQLRRVEKKKDPINKISDTLKQELITYGKRKQEYFTEHPVCEFPGCTSTNVCIHHSRGRVGKLLTDKKWFKSLCDEHHRWAEINPEAAVKLGLSFSRLKKENN